MGTEAVKSTQVTNLDAFPVTRNTSGKNGLYSPIVIEQSVTVADAKDSGSTYRMVRIPSNAIVKKVEVWFDAAVTTFTADLGIYYSSNATDEVGASQGKTGVVNADHFASAVAMAALVAPTDKTFEAGTYLGADLQKEVWQASGGLSSDPGGFFDVTATATATTSTAGVFNMRVTYALPYAS